MSASVSPLNGASASGRPLGIPRRAFLIRCASSKIERRSLAEISARDKKCFGLDIKASRKKSLYRNARADGRKILPFKIIQALGFFETFAQNANSFTHMVFGNDKSRSKPKNIIASTTAQQPVFERHTPDIHS